MTFSLEKLEQLEKSADPMPWKAVVSKDDNGFSTSWRLVGDDPYMPGQIDIMYYRKPEHNVALIEAMRNSLPAILRRLRAADALREGVAYYYHGCAAGDRNIYCELCRVLAKYDKDIEK